MEPCDGLVQCLFEGGGDMMLDGGKFFVEIKTEVAEILELYFVDDGGKGDDEVRLAIDR